MPEQLPMLLKEIQDGAEDGFAPSHASLAALLTQRAQFLAFVRRRVNDTELAEDILQAAYMRALEKSDGLREEESAVAWFYRVLRNAVIDYYRRRATESSAMEQWGREVETTVPDASTRTFVCGCIEHVLPTLRPAYAEILREVDLTEKSLGAFAAEHGVSAGNAAVRAHRARAALKRALAKTCGACSLHACLDCVCKMPEARV
jgi:RNA polymerase sigma factor (sigma-70 family)